MIGENTHLKQTVETHEIPAFLDEHGGIGGVATVNVTVLNGCKIDDIDLRGRKVLDFACLRDCVKSHLANIYDMRGFDFAGL